MVLMVDVNLIVLVVEFEWSLAFGRFEFDFEFERAREVTAADFRMELAVVEFLAAVAGLGTWPASVVKPVEAIFRLRVPHLSLPIVCLSLPLMPIVSRRLQRQCQIQTMHLNPTVLQIQHPILGRGVMLSVEAAMSKTDQALFLLSHGNTTSEQALDCWC